MGKTNLTPQICVVGASNYDLVSYVNRLPVMGETIHGKSFQMGFGGKGANQAVAAAKLGADVSVITKLGSDSFGRDTMENFKNYNINTEKVFLTDQAFSGVALIAVDSNGNNSIIIVTGANDFITEAEIISARNIIAKSQILICQLEIPINISKIALKIAREEGVTTILNPAPVPQSGLPDEIYSLCDFFCPNQSETELLTGIKIQNIIDAEKAGRMLLDKGIPNIILTLGEDGSLLVTQETVNHVPAPKVTALDTSGAGDCFIGSFAYFYAKGDSTLESVRKANIAAAYSVQHYGTQKSYPTGFVLE